MPQITPFLWFDYQAEEAAEFYVSIFGNSRILEVSREGEPDVDVPARAMSVTFELDGRRLIAFNGGPEFPFTPAISFFVDCETQAEVDERWERLSAGGQPGQCGWLTDRYGVSWQIVPTILGHLLSDPDPARAQRVTEAMLKMGKLEIAELQAAYDQT